MTLSATLHQIQQDLKAPKGQTNSFGGYKYRSCEDILEAVKPLLPDGISLVLDDEVVCIGERYYVKATARLCMDGSSPFTATAYAREALSQKGMNDAQLTGSASSYARKYALNGLFCIDDTKDADDSKSRVEARAREKQSDADEFVADNRAPVTDDAPVTPVDEALARKLIDQLMGTKSPKAANTIISKHKENLDHPETPAKFRDDVRSVYKGRLDYFKEREADEANAELDREFAEVAAG